MTRVDKLKIVMLAISLTILTFLFLFRYLSVYCVSLYYTYLPTYLSTMQWVNKEAKSQRYIWLS